MMIGLTGGYCAGKNRAEAILAKMGFISLDVDKLGHEALFRSRDEVVGAFGPKILDSNGEINRRALGAVVFKSESALARLEAITHPIMFSLVDGWISGNPGKKLCINAFVLYKMPHVKSCDLILEIEAPFFLRVFRGLKRDGLSPFKIVFRILSQRRLLASGSRFPQVVKIGNAGTETALEIRIRQALGNCTGTSFGNGI